MTVALVFPGQGSQSVGMGRSVYERYEEARAIKDEAEAVLGYSLSEIMFHGPIETLEKTLHTQSAILMTSMMLFRAMEAVRPDIISKTKYVAGHSVGEYAALAASGCLPFAEIVDLVNCRAAAMNEATKICNGGMCAILGITKEQIQGIIDHEKIRDCFVANDNCPGQIVISGERRAVESVRDFALQSGATRGVMLSVSGAFHSPLMKSAADTFAKKIEDLSFSPGRFSVISNVTAEPAQAEIGKRRSPDEVSRASFDKSFSEQVKSLLVQQIVKPVRWSESVEAMVKANVTTMIEIGNGRILSGLCKRCSKDLEIISVQSAEDIETLPKLL